MVHLEQGNFLLGHRSALDDYPPDAETEGMGSPYAQKILHFYCYECKGYELKTSPHYKAQKQRFARRKKARAAKKPTTTSAQPQP